MLAWRLAKSVEESINTILVSSGGSVPLLTEGEGYLNLSLVSDPIYVDEYLSFPLDGAFSRKVSTNGKSSSGTTDYPKMPVFVRTEDSGQVQSQVFVSERTVNSALDTLGHAGVLKFPYTV